MDWTRVRYSVVDVEGNGHQPPDLVELAVVPVVDGVVGDPRTWLVKPPRPIRHLANRVHGITNEDVNERPVFADVEPEVRAAVEGTAVVAHNAHVDVNVLRRHLTGWVPVEVFDTLKLARRLAPDQPSYRLGRLVEAFGLTDDLPDGLHPHRAGYDALIAARLFVHLARGRTHDQLTAAMRSDTAQTAPLF